MSEITTDIRYWAILTDPEIPANVTILPNLFSGPHNESAKVTVYPWPFISSGKLANISITVTPGKRTLHLKVSISVGILVFIVITAVHIIFFILSDKFMSQLLTGSINPGIFVLLFYRLSHHLS